MDKCKDFNTVSFEEQTSLEHLIQFHVEKDWHWATNVQLIPMLFL